MYLGDNIKVVREYRDRLERDPLSVLRDAVHGDSAACAILDNVKIREDGKIEIHPMKSKKESAMRVGLKNTAHVQFVVEKTGARTYYYSQQKTWRYTAPCPWEEKIWLKQWLVSTFF